jgi:thiamine biosynthesis lipoprotein ApbE
MVADAYATAMMAMGSQSAIVLAKQRVCETVSII